MPTEPSTSRDRVLGFGPFELSEQEGELRKSGVRIKLQEQPFRVLVELVANSGKVVSREDLHRKLWPADTFVDFDVGLNSAIRKLRQALNDDADHPHYIETLAKRGYRFLAPVVDRAAAPQTTSKDSPPGTTVSVPGDGTSSATREEIQRKPRRWYWVLAAACVLAVVAYGALVAWRRASTSPPLATEQQITANPHEAPITGAVISPDGKYVAYSDTTGVYIRHIDTGEVRPLQLPEELNAIAIPTSWFPDSTRLLLKSGGIAPVNPSLWKVSILGGNPQKVMEDATDGAVSTDGSKIAFLRGAYPPREIWVVETNGSNSRRIVQAESGSYIASVAWSPHGRRLAYVRSAAFGYLAGDKYTLETADLSGKTSTVLQASALVPALCWAPDSRLLYAFRADPASERWESGMWSIRVNEESGKPEGRPQELTKGVGQIGGLSITADGKRLVLWRTNFQLQVFLTEIDPSTRRFKQPRRLTLDQNGNVVSAWTPDSTAVVFVSNRNGTWKLFRQAIDQVTPEVLVEGRGIYLPRLSPDGKHILYETYNDPENPAQGASIMQIPQEGGSPRFVLRMPSLTNFQCAQSPSKLCLFDTLEGSTDHFFSFNPGDGMTQKFATVNVTNDFGGWNLSPDGSQLALTLSSHESKVTFMSVGDKSTHQVEFDPWLPHSLDWAADSKSVYIAGHSANGTTVILGVEPNGVHRVLLESDKATQYQWVVPSPDGRYGALEVATGENNVWMVQNF